jgi:hypothetical protein
LYSRSYQPRRPHAEDLRITRLSMCIAWSIALQAHASCRNCCATTDLTDVSLPYLEFQPSALKPCHQHISRRPKGRLRPQCALPDCPESPASPQQCRPNGLVSFHVRCELGSPEIRASSRSGREAAPGVPVPEATMHEDGRPVFREYQIGPAGETLRMQAVPESQRVQGPPECQFRLRVLAADPGHHAGACQFVDNVDHLPLGLRPFTRYTTSDVNSRDV